MAKVVSDPSQPLVALLHGSNVCLFDDGSSSSPRCTFPIESSPGPAPAHIITGAFSPCGTLFVIARADKRVEVYSTNSSNNSNSSGSTNASEVQHASNNNNSNGTTAASATTTTTTHTGSTSSSEATWRLVKTAETERKVTALVVSSDSRHAIMADKTGNFFQLALTGEDKEMKLLGGHVSMLLDVLLVGKYILTCERDEKIRISRYPKAYVIESFCMGHTEFVSAAVALSDSLVISGSGDGTLRLWSVPQGLEVFCLDVQPADSAQNQKMAIRKLAKFPHENTLAVVFDNSHYVFLVREDSDALVVVGQTCLESVVTDVCCSASNHIWITSQDEAEPVTVWTVQSDYELTRTPGWQQALCDERIKGWNLHTVLEEFIALGALRKQPIDNMGKYLSKKEARSQSKRPKGDGAAASAAASESAAAGAGGESSNEE